MESAEELDSTAMMQRWDSGWVIADRQMAAKELGIAW